MPTLFPPLSPLPPEQWDRAKAAHLLNRAGFGGAPEQIDTLAGLGLQAAVRGFVNGPAQPAAALPPVWAKPEDRLAFREKVRTAAFLAAVDGNDPGALATMLSQPEGMMAGGKGPGQGKGGGNPQDLVKNLSPEVRQAVQSVRKEQRQMQQGHLVELVAWWLGRMAAAEDPLQEKLTLFWHGHFATSAQKVNDAYLMWRQNQTLREHARGNFGAMVKAVSRDPAMIFWLDLQQSRLRKPNENFAREVMELFTLGEGHYTEADIAEGARAFTGYRIDPRTEAFRFAVNEHDATPKRFLGQQGMFDGDGIIDVILNQPACAPFIARKLWTFFAYEDPEPAVVDTLALALRQSHFDLKPVLYRMFFSREFYSARAVRTQIKSPVQWLVSTARTLEIDLPGQPQLLLGALRQMGQVLFMPPSVKGWDGGKAWISTATLLARYNLAGALLHGRPVPAFAAEPFRNKVGGNPGGDATRVNLATLAPADLRENPDALIAALTHRLFQTPLPAKQHTAFLDFLRSQPPGRPTDGAVLGLLHLMMSTPQFQLC